MNNLNKRTFNKAMGGLEYPIVNTFNADVYCNDCGLELPPAKERTCPTCGVVAKTCSAVEHLNHSSQCLRCEKIGWEMTVEHRGEVA